MTIAYNKKELSKIKNKKCSINKFRYNKYKQVEVRYYKT